MKAGTTVRLIQPEIRGQVLERRVTPADDIELLVSYTDASGETHTRWFADEQIEEVPA
mgnify:CR=1 FL=1